MNAILDRQTFTCIAEGVGHYYDLGFRFDEDIDMEGRQGFHPDGREVWVRHSGKTAQARFLNVIATVIMGKCLERNTL